MSNIEVPLSEKTGISMCLEIYAEVTADGYDLGSYKSVRQAFIKRAVGEAGMTQKGAESYYTICKRKSEGKPMYYGAKPGAKEKKPKTNAVQTFVDIANQIVASQKVERALEAAKATLEEQQDEAV